MKVTFDVFDTKEKKVIKPIYKQYDGKLLDFFIGINGGLIIYANNIDGFENGFTHESFYENRYKAVLNVTNDDELKRHFIGE